jgi:hypothetical protein
LASRPIFHFLKKSLIYTQDRTAATLPGSGGTQTFSVHEQEEAFAFLLDFRYSSEAHNAPSLGWIVEARRQIDGPTLTFKSNAWRQATPASARATFAPSGLAL